MVPSARVEAEVVPEVGEGVSAGFVDDASAQEQSAEPALADGGDAQAGPFGNEAAVPVVAEVVGDQWIVAGIVSKGLVHLVGRVAVLLEVVLGVAVDCHGFPRDGHVVVQEHAERSADGVPAFH